MSRVGKKPISLVKGVDVKITGRKVAVKGPKGNLEYEVPEGIQIAHVENELVLSLVKDDKELSSFFGLARALVQNLVTGVTNGFDKELELIGVGYRAAVKGSLLDLQLGFSHPVELPIPSGIEVKIEKGTAVTISGIDKQLVGGFAAKIRAKRPPEPYKGKGVRYKGEFVRKKAGKTGK